VNRIDWRIAAVWGVPILTFWGAVGIVLTRILAK
jgi:hypothetical protein